jgi:hypothetical protein
MVPLVAAAALCAAAGGGTAAADRWQHVTVTRHEARIQATLSYDRRAGGLVPEYRRLSLVVRRAGRVVIRTRDPQVRLGDVRGLSLRNVWGSAEPETLVDLWTGGNHCCLQRRVGLVDDRARARVLAHDFPFGDRGQWHRGTFDFVSTDYRFYCAFTACAGASQPLRIFAIDKAGRRFIDVTRSRPDLIRVDAAGHWRWINGGPRYPAGEVAPWCADKYLLRQKERCERVLAEVRTHGADGWSGSGGAAGFIRFLHERLRAWGYA